MSDPIWPKRLAIFQVTVAEVGSQLSCHVCGLTCCTAASPSEAERSLRSLTEHKLPAFNQFAAEMDHFALCIKNNTQPRTPGAEGLLDIRAMVAINQAVATGRTVEV